MENTQQTMKDIALGYYYNCMHCGVENAFGVTQQEADAEALEWERDNADLVEDGETGEGSVDWWYNVTAEENNAHIEQAHKCWKCEGVQTAWAQG
tara:strand:- start:579 stop:863 length:285 start_codon:yes stop_codon:yes gene_type:complete